MRYAFITEYRMTFPVGLMCDVLLVSRSGYYCLGSATNLSSGGTS